MVVVGVQVEKGGVVECRVRIYRGEAQGGLTGGAEKATTDGPSFSFFLLNHMLTLSTCGAHVSLIVQRSF